jgi:hypothetical protein
MIVYKKKKKKKKKKLGKAFDSLLDLQSIYPNNTPATILDEMSKEILYVK